MTRLTFLVLVIFVLGVIYVEFARGNPLSKDEFKLSESKNYLGAAAEGHAGDINFEISELSRIKREGEEQDMSEASPTPMDGEEPGVLERLANYAMALLKKFVQWLNSEN